MTDTRLRARIGWRLAIVGVSLAPYIASFVIPALRFRVTGAYGAEDRIMTGAEVALWGWAAVFKGNLGWLANFVYFPSLMMVLVGLWRLAAPLAALALLLSLHSLSLFQVSFWADEAGARQMVLTHLEMGFFFWIGALLLAVIGSLLGVVCSRK